MFHFGFDHVPDGGGPLFRPEAMALFARMSVPPSGARRVLIGGLVAGLVASGIWAKLDVFQMFAAHDAQAARLNWKGASFGASVTAGAPLFIADRGYYCDGIDDCLSTGWAPSAGVAYQQNDCCLGGWVLEGGQRINAPMGSGTAAAVLLSPRSGSDKIVARLNSSASTTSTSSVATGYGMTIACRTGASAVTLWRNGAQVDGTFTTASATRSSIGIDFGRSNSVFVEQQALCWFAGAALSGAEQAILYALLSAYFAALGVAPLDVATGSVGFAARQVLPDGANPQLAGRGLPGCGLAVDGVDGSLWVGWSLGTMSANAGLAHLSADGASLIAEYSTVALGAAAGIAVPAASGTQGVAYDGRDDTLWWVSVDSVNGQCWLCHADLVLGAPVLLSCTLLPNADQINSVTVDSKRGQLILLNEESGRFDWYNVNTSGVASLATPARFGTNPGGNSDHVHYVAALDRVLVSGGPNGGDGYVHEFALAEHYGGMWLRRNITLTGADAVEGVSYDATTGMLRIANDGYTHASATFAYNTVMRFAVG